MSALCFQFGQAWFDVSGVLPDRLQRSSDIVASVRRTLALSPQGQRHHGRLQGELVLIQTLKDIR